MQLVQIMDFPGENKASKKDLPIFHGKGPEKPCQPSKHLIEYIGIISGVKEVRAWLIYVLFAEKGLLQVFRSATPISGQSGLGNLTCKGFTPSSTALRPGSVFAPDAYVPVKFNVQYNVSIPSHRV